MYLGQTNTKVRIKMSMDLYNSKTAEYIKS